MQLLQEFQAFVRGAAGTTALALNGDAISSIHAPNDADFARLPRQRVEILDQSRQVNGLAENEMYILRPVSAASPFETEFVVMLQKKTFIGSRYTLPLANRAPISRGLENEAANEQRRLRGREWPLDQRLRDRSSIGLASRSR